jgi:hypothetical protein
MLLPAFSMMGTGIAQYIRLKEQERKSMLVAAPLNQTLPDRRPYSTPRNLPPRNTGEVGGGSSQSDTSRSQTLFDASKSSTTKYWRVDASCSQRHRRNNQTPRCRSANSSP